MINRREFVTYAGAVSMGLPRLGAFPAVEPGKQAATYHEAPRDMVVVQDAPFAFVARNTFADLLKIPLSDPDASVSVRSVKEEEGLKIEDISWKTLDGQEVPAYVLHPAKATGRSPAILWLHPSHSSRETEVEQAFRQGPSPFLYGVARELARRGYLILAPTQRGMGGREPNEDVVQAKDLLIRGRNLMGLQVYEIRQAITCLQQRDDVDAAKIGMGGFSWGGATSFYTWLVDLRVAATACICGAVGSVDTYSRIGSHSYNGLSWWIPDMLLKGDQGDFAAAMAPRPLMLWAPTEDIGMPKEGVDRFVATVRPAYKCAGAGDALLVYQRPGIHEFTMQAFERMNEFLGQHLRK